MTQNFKEMAPEAMDEFLNAMNQKAEDLLKKFFVGKELPGEPWTDELFDVTMQVIVDTTVANTDVTDFDIKTAIEGHILFMNVQDDQDNTICDVIYTVTINDEDKDSRTFTVDSVQVAFKPGAFVALDEVGEAPEDELPF